MFSSRPLRRLALPATLAAASLLVAGCASGPEVRADYDHAADFGKYRTYGFVSQTTPLTDRPVRARRACLQEEDFDESVARRNPRMNVATIAPAQPAADSPPLDEALRESLAREFHVSAWQVEAIYREELCRLRRCPHQHVSRRTCDASRTGETRALNPADRGRESRPQSVVRI